MFRNRFFKIYLLINALHHWTLLFSTKWIISIGTLKKKDTFKYWSLLRIGIPASLHKLNNLCRCVLWNEVLCWSVTFANTLAHVLFAPGIWTYWISIPALMHQGHTGCASYKSQHTCIWFLPREDDPNHDGKAVHVGFLRGGCMDTSQVLWRHVA